MRSSGSARRAAWKATAYAFGRGLPVAGDHRERARTAPARRRSGAARADPRPARRARTGPTPSAGCSRSRRAPSTSRSGTCSGRRVGAPLADLLGRRRTEVPVCGVGGYKRQGDDGLDGLQDEMAGFLAARLPGRQGHDRRRRAGGRRSPARRGARGRRSRLRPRRRRLPVLHEPRRRAPQAAAACSSRSTSPTSRIRSRRAWRRSSPICGGAPGC